MASPVGFNQNVVQNNKTGIFAQDEAEWVTAFRTLAANRELLRAFGIAGRRRVEEKYSLNSAAPKLARTMLQVVQEGYAELPADYPSPAQTDSPGTPELAIH